MCVCYHVHAIASSALKLEGKPMEVDIPLPRTDWLDALRTSPTWFEDSHAVSARTRMQRNFIHAVFSVAVQHSAPQISVNKKLYLVCAVRKNNVCPISGASLWLPHPDPTYLEQLRIPAK